MARRKRYRFAAHTADQTEPIAPHVVPPGKVQRGAGTGGARNRLTAGLVGAVGGTTSKDPAGALTPDRIDAAHYVNVVGPGEDWRAS